MEFNGENIARVVEAVENILERSRKGLVALLVVMSIGLFIQYACWNFRSTQDDVEYLRSVVQKLSEKAGSAEDVMNEVSAVGKNAKEKLDSFKRELGEAMSGMTDGVKRGERFDYALEGAGGSVVSYHNSQLLYDCSRLETLSGMCNEINPPSKAIQTSVEPGQAFCFKGNQGALTIRLTCAVAIDSVTIDHVNQAMAPVEYVSEAPKEFTLMGLKTWDDPHGVNLGSNTFDGSHSSQTFQVFGPPDEKFRYVRVNITGNHGSEEKTCLYRIRVHGFVTEC